MSKIVGFAKGVRNHWKKSVFASLLLAYGSNYAYDKYQISRLMRSYCEEAASYGDQIVPLTAPIKRVVVILNPTANKRGSEALFTKYCEPILHVAGFYVDLVKTEYEGYARKYVEEMAELPDAILAAGGDGTVSEIVTGVLRRPNQSHKKCVVGILPVGRTNSIGKNLFEESLQGRVAEAKGVAKAALSVVRGETLKKDVLKIELLQNGEEEVVKKPIYAMGSIKLGAFRDALSKRDKYWYTGGLREYSSILFSTFSASKLNWNLNGEIITTPTCSGCSNCYVKIENPNTYQSRSWWRFLIPQAKHDDGSVVNGVNMKAVQNEECSKESLLSLNNANEVYLTTSNTEKPTPHSLPQLTVRVGEENKGTMAFIKEGWHRLRSDEVDLTTSHLLSARTVQIHPKVENDQIENYLSIDNEDFELRPIKVTLLPNFINVFVNKQSLLA